MSEKNPVGFDIIGDIHGCADLLEGLLESLGYGLDQGVYSHPERQAIFLGDLLDRGSQIRRVVTTVRNMVEHGSANMVLGNHEYAAITYSTPSPAGFDQPYLRKHSKRSRSMLHQTLLQYADHQEEWMETVAWLKTLPLYLEYPGFRVVHACWDQHKIDLLKSMALEQPLLDQQFLVTSAVLGTTENRIVERLLKGTDIPLPEGYRIVGADGLERTRFRSKFWRTEPETYGDVVFQPDRLPPELLDRVLDDRERKRLVYYGTEQKPLFVGHYWRRGTPRLIRSNIACLDYSAVKSGLLLAYRFDSGDQALDSAKLFWTQKRVG